MYDLFVHQLAYPKKLETTGVRWLSRRGHLRDARMYSSSAALCARISSDGQRLVDPQPYRAAAFRATSMGCLRSKDICPPEVVSWTDQVIMEDVMKETKTRYLGEHRRLADVWR